MSGLTTTGVTALAQINQMSGSLLLCRVTTHWLDGLGVLVAFGAVLPTPGKGGKRVFRVEWPGLTP